VKAVLVAVAILSAAAGGALIAIEIGHHVGTPATSPTSSTSTSATAAPTTTTTTPLPPHQMP